MHPCVALSGAPTAPVPPFLALQLLPLTCLLLSAHKAARVWLIAVKSFARFCIKLDGQMPMPTRMLNNTKEGREN